MLPLIAAGLVVFIAALLLGKSTVRARRTARDGRRFALAKAHQEFVDKEGDRRASAADFLARTGDSNVILTLLRGRRDPIGSHPEDRCVDRALALLCESLRLDATQVRRDYDLRIVTITPVNDLLPWFNCSDLVVRNAAMKRIAVALHEAPSGEFADQILALVFSDSAEFNVRQRAAETLAMALQEERLILRAVEILEASSDNSTDREDAIEILARFGGGPEAVPCLIKQAQEQRWGMSPRAIKGLTRILKSRGEKLSTGDLESIKSLLARPVLVAVAAPDDPGSISVETVNTIELETLVSDLLSGRYRPRGEK